MEIFGSGTAAVISPVGELKYGDTVITVGDGQVGPWPTSFSRPFRIFSTVSSKAPGDGWSRSEKTALEA
jgi:hypothetical protein